MTFFADSMQKVLYKQLYQKPLVMVVGMHRSGTGLLTEILQRLGVFMGKNLSGNRESLFFQGINKELLDVMGCNWRHIDELPNPDGILSQCSWMVDYAKQRIELGLVHGHFDITISTFFRGLPKNWGWKDPRNSLLIPIWQTIFPQISVVHIFRDGRDVALSLLKREMKRNKAKGIMTDIRMRNSCIGYLDLWEKYVRRINASWPSIEKRHCLSYENLVKNPGQEIRSLAASLCVTMTSDACAIVDAGRNSRARVERFPWFEDLRLTNPLLSELGYDPQT